MTLLYAFPQPTLPLELDSAEEVNFILLDVKGDFFHPSYDILSTKQQYILEGELGKDSSRLFLLSCHDSEAQQRFSSLSLYLHVLSEKQAKFS